MDDQITNLPENISPINNSLKEKLAWPKRSVKYLLLTVLSFPIFKIIISLVFVFRYLLDLQRISLPQFFYDLIATLITALIIYAIAKVLKLNKAKVFALAIFAVYIFLLAFLDFYYRPYSQSLTIRTPTPTAAPTQISQEPKSTSPLPPYYLKLLENTSVKERTIEPSKEASLDCQPEFFDPKIAKFHKIKEEGTPSEFYVLDNNEYVHFMINGWYKEEKDKVILPSPYEVTMYQFGCASTFSFVLDITKNKERLFLFTHVRKYEFYPEKKLLFVKNEVKNDAGEWEGKIRIINLETKGQVELPIVECTSDSGSWSQEKLITYGGTDYGCPGITSICVWNNKGQLEKQLDGYLDQFAGAACYMTSQLGLLPSDKNILYTTVIGNSHQELSDKCRLVLQDLNAQEKNASFFIHNFIKEDLIYHCMGPFEFDLKGINLNSKIIKYRAWDNPGKKWSDWKEAMAEGQLETTLSPTPY